MGPGDSKPHSQGLSHNPYPFSCIAKSISVLMDKIPAEVIEKGQVFYQRLLKRRLYKPFLFYLFPC